MEPDVIDNNAIITKVTEAHELVEKLKTEIFGEEERKIMRRVVHKMLFYFLVTLMAGSVIGLFYGTGRPKNGCPWRSAQASSP